MNPRPRPRQSRPRQSRPAQGRPKRPSTYRLAEYLTVAGLAIVLVIVGGLTRAALNARRLAGWDADWLASGPRWSPRR